MFKGLAVPEAVPIKLADLPFLRKGQRLAWDLSLTDTGYIVESFEGAPFHDHVRPAAPAKMIGVWLFCLEQFVAFRRHQILYTDIKCSNIVATHDPWRVVIVDFDRVVPLVGGRYHYGNLGVTAGFDPPEARTSNKRMTEAACVYQLGILLLHFLTRGVNVHLEDQKLGLPKLSQILRRQRIDPLIDLFRRSIAADPRRRPQSFEDVLQEVHRMRIPPQSLDTWAELRAPSATKLAAVELALPTPPARPRRHTR